MASSYCGESLSVPLYGPARQIFGLERLASLRIKIPLSEIIMQLRGAHWVPWGRDGNAKWEVFRSTATMLPEPDSVTKLSAAVAIPSCVAIETLLKTVRG